MTTDEKAVILKYFIDIDCDDGNKILQHIKNINKNYDGKYVMEIWCLIKQYRNVLFRLRNRVTINILL